MSSSAVEAALVLLEGIGTGVLAGAEEVGEVGVLLSVSSSSFSSSMQVSRGS
jgi:hypothetical protein